MQQMNASRSPSQALERARRVQLLSPAVAERIAAGEVIERPASVVKELVENSLDAGASEVLIRLEDGGRSLIEITDNGCGMNADDLALSIRRHATSKLRELADLDKMNTLGFRGEALPSIGAVSELSIISRPIGGASALELRASGPEHQGRDERPAAVTFGHFLGSPHGTRIQARGLFSQIPARLKFLKAKSAETAHVREWTERLALAYPHVRFRLLSDERPILTLNADTEAARARAILSGGDDFPVITAGEDSDPVLKIRIHWLQGLSTPQARKLVQIVNGRAVRDRLLQQAMLQPFRQLLLPGQFPALMLSLEIDPAHLDVNVHPTKSEVRFLESRRVFQAISELIARMVERNGAPAFAPGLPAFQGSGPSQPGPTQDWIAPRAQSDLFRAAEPGISAGRPLAGTQELEVPSSEGEPQSGPQASHPFKASRSLGIAFNTYLLYDLGEELGLIDQHAADERIRYERLKRRLERKTHGEALPPQALLIPEAVKFPIENRETLERNLTELNRAGFEVELFGDDTLLFRSVPPEWGNRALRARLKNLLDKVLAASEASERSLPLSLDEVLFESLASEACHSSVRAGDRLEPAEAHALVDQLFACHHPWNCPHGRPTVVRVPRARLEEWFQRRV